MFFLWLPTGTSASETGVTNLLDLMPHKILSRLRKDGTLWKAAQKRVSASEALAWKPAWPRCSFPGETLCRSPRVASTASGNVLEGRLLGANDVLRSSPGETLLLGQAV